MQASKVIALYIRLSVEDGDLKGNPSKTESNSVSNQRKIIREYLGSHDLAQYKPMEFCDDGYTGTNFLRPQFQKMMEMVKAKQVGCIIVKDLSRFGREYLEVGAYLEMVLPLYGIRFISVNDSFDSSDYIGTTGGFELALRNLINGMYSKDLSMKVKTAIKTRNKKGEYLCGNPFYGYLNDPRDRHKLIVDESVRSVVERIFRECIAGSSAASIATGLNADGIPTPSEHKRSLGMSYNGREKEKQTVWLSATVRQILIDERYTGKMVFGKRQAAEMHAKSYTPVPREQWIIVPDTHEAIISEETYRQAAIARQSRVRTVNRNTAGDRAGNLFVCGYCGRKLQKSCAKVPHYFCIKARSSPGCDCGLLHEPVEMMQKSALQMIQAMAKALIDASVQEKAQSNKRLDDLLKAIRKCDAEISRIQNGKTDLYEQYRSNQITKERFLLLQESNLNKVDQLQEERRRLQHDLEQLRSEMETASSRVSSAKEIFILREYKPEIIKKLVKEIMVFADRRIVLEMNVSDPFA